MNKDKKITKEFLLSIGFTIEPMKDVKGIIFYAWSGIDSTDKYFIEFAIDQTWWAISHPEDKCPIRIREIKTQKEVVVWLASFYFHDGKKEQTEKMRLK